MIIYDSKKWGSLFSTISKTFMESYNMRQLFWSIFISAIYASVVTILNMEYYLQKFTIDTVFFSLIGVILSLFLVFRLNSAYDRWWEGRKAWGKLVNDARTLALTLNGMIPEEDRKRRTFFVKNISNFCQALQWHLRDDVRHDKFIYVNKTYNDELDKSGHVPNTIMSYMFVEVEHMDEENMISDYDKKYLRELLQGFIDVLGVCERIKATPIPFSHSTFIKLFIILYIFILPFGLVNVFQYLTIPSVIVMAFATLGVEIISEEIENPFGLDANDLPTGSITEKIQDNMYEILHVKSEFKSTPKAKESDVLH